MNFYFQISFNLRVTVALKNKFYSTHRIKVSVLVYIQLLLEVLCYPFTTGITQLLRFCRCCDNKETIAGFQCQLHSKYILKKSKLFNTEIKSRIWEMKEGKYAKKTLAKIQVTAILLKQDMRRNVLPKLIEICMETPCWCPSGWAPTWWPETDRIICH